MKRSNMRRILFNVLLIILAFTIQNCIFPLLPFLSAAPNLLLILTFSFGFMHGKEAGMYYGLLSGLLMDLFYSGPFGFYTLIFIFVGYMNGICTRYYYEDYITLPLILSVLNELAYNLYIYVFRFLIRQKLRIGFYFINLVLPEIIFTVVTTLLLYRLFLIMNRRLEEIEKRGDSTIV
ncbi:rod shape-determining protein MreD [Lacrimispora amygdalina]|uniref:rod shape-determining protein MreD n=2 Tax=Lacrimispora TaxID=2719231 RepID=UPI001A9A4181